MNDSSGTVRASADSGTPPAAWSPLRIPVFRAVWLATLVSNIGTWMHDIGAGWLMTSLSPDPVMVALVQTATSLPVFLLAMPAGALSDSVDRRRYLLATQAWMVSVALVLSALTLSGLTTAWVLIGLTFALGVGHAMSMPAWAAVTPELVPRNTLQPAIALNSLGINVARAVGPALAGVIVAFAGTGAVFMLNALSFAGVIFVLARWQHRSEASVLPAERFAGALRAGFRYARHASELQAAVFRGCVFFLFASASWALLPLIARQLVGGGPQTFGILVGSVGAGAVAGAFVLPSLRQRLSRDVLVAGATVLYAAAMLAMANVGTVLPLSLVMAVSGVAWITVLSSLQVAAQMALPNWVRARGLAVFMMTIMGSMALGSLIWGKVAQVFSIPLALTLAAAGAVLGAVLSMRWRISGFENSDLSPSMHWPVPVTHAGVSGDRGPVLVTIVYDVEPDSRAAFIDAMRTLGRHRRRDGAFAWSLFEHAAQADRFIETFSDASWLDHLRQHTRVTDADRELQARVRTLLKPGTEPDVQHYITPAKAERKTRGKQP